MVSITFFLLTSLFSSTALSGGMTSSGGEFITTEKNPWFTGESDIHYCIKKSNYFSVEIDDTRKIIKEAIKDWTLTLKLLNPKKTSFKLPDGNYKNLSLNFKEVNCNKENIQLWFYLGSFNKEIEQSLSTMAKFTAAFAGHLGINNKTGRTKKGIIWLAPDMGPRKYIGPSISKQFWMKDQIFFNTLLHELGHMFGLGHLEDGIMNNGFPARMIRYGGSKISTKVFRFHKWQSLKLSICGKGLQLDEHTARELLETSYIILWDVCLIPKRDISPMGLTEFELTFVSEKGVVKKEFDFQMKEGSSFSTDMRSISGKYFKSKVEGPLNLNNHNFLSLQDNRFSGYLIDKKGHYPVFINKRGARLEINIAKNNKIHEISFYINNFSPLFK